MLNKIYSAKRNEVVFDKNTNSLYAFLLDKTRTNIDRFEINNLSNNTGLFIDYKIHSIPYVVIDENFIYIITQNSELIIADKFNGEISDKIQIKSICSSNIVQDEDHIYLLCVLPTRIKNMAFSTYFIQKINKITHKITKFNFFNGIVTKKLLLKNKNLYFSDLDSLKCINTDGIIQWETKFHDKMDNQFIENDKYIVVSSKKGTIQAFSVLGGDNEFNIKLLESSVSPVFDKSNNIIYWFNEDNYCMIDIEKLKTKEPDWQKCEQSILPVISCGFFDDNLNILGSINGQIESGKDFIETNKSPIISIKKIGHNLFLIENQTEFFVFEQTK
jgi:hypothetical protein